MDDLKPQRRLCKFSLRKLMLWMVVVAAYLGVLKAANFRLADTVVLTIYLFVVLVIRQIWGFGRAFLIVVFVIGWIPVRYFQASLVEMHILSSLPPATEIYVYGFTSGFFGLVVVHFLAVIVDWIDNLMLMQGR